MYGVAKAAYDPVGHYLRPDVLRLMFNNKATPRGSASRRRFHEGRFIKLS